MPSRPTGWPCALRTSRPRGLEFPRCSLSRSGPDQPIAISRVSSDESSPARIPRSRRTPVAPSHRSRPSPLKRRQGLHGRGDATSRSSPISAGDAHAGSRRHGLALRACERGACPQSNRIMVSYRPHHQSRILSGRGASLTFLCGRPSPHRQERRAGLGSGERLGESPRWRKFSRSADSIAPAPSAPRSRPFAATLRGGLRPGSLRVHDPCEAQEHGSRLGFPGRRQPRGPAAFGNVARDLQVLLPS